MNNSVNDNKKEPDCKGQSNIKTNKSKIFWGILFVFIAAFSIWAVVGQSNEFSLSDFVKYIASSANIYLLLAFVAIFGFVFFEGLSVVYICKAMGYKQKVSHGLIYSSADVYFSAITPSATGGQPASAFFMAKDGIPLSVATVALIVNVIMYTLSVLSFGVISFILDYTTFFSFDLFSRILICIGITTQVLLIALSLLLLKKAGIIYRVGCVIINFFAKIKLIRKKEKKLAKLEAYICSYKECASALGGKSKTLVVAYILNMIQRACIMAVLFFSYLATGGNISNTAKIWSTQGLVTLGANSVPIPGSMGIVDYVLLDGLDALMDRADAVNLELLSRGISFYICIFTCGAATLAAYIALRIKRKKHRKCDQTLKKGSTNDRLL